MTYALRIRRAMQARTYDPAERVRSAIRREESECRAMRRTALALLAASLAAFALALAI